MEDLDALKRQLPETGEPKYILHNSRVFVSPGGFHFIRDLDPVDNMPTEIDRGCLGEAERKYIEHSLQFNKERFAHQADIVAAYVNPSGSNVLDIGCGGGLFLSLLKAAGARVTGIELSDSRAAFAETQYGIPIEKRPIESEFWVQNHAQAFDAVTLWDVLEHVNFPGQTLRAAAAVLREGGVLFIDTPCRDSFYHRVGQFTYWLTRGRFPTFLNTLYSSHLFGHKQIFSTTELRQLMESNGFEVLQVTKFHELSFPYEYYLAKMLKSKILVVLALPWVRLFLAIFRIRNKALVVGRKTATRLAHASQPA